MDPQPVVFSPILKAKPWGGRRLARLGKTLPAEQPIGESWELADLPGDVSCVARGPLAGRSIRELMNAWGKRLLGDADPADGRFPLLIKFLDAREHLSIQTHPRPADHDPHGWAPGIKHECWYVVDAEPNSELFIGLRPEATLADVEAAGDSPRVVELLQRRPARRGDCYFLPSGTLHALGAGVLVAEVQTPSDTTYRLYDWGRTDAHGRPRELHVTECLTNIREQVEESELWHADAAHSDCGLRRLVRSSRFELDEFRLSDDSVLSLGGGMSVLMLIEGELSIEVQGARGSMQLHTGETALIPAALPAIALRAKSPGALGLRAWISAPSLQ